MMLGFGYQVAIKKCSIVFSANCIKTVSCFVCQSFHCVGIVVLSRLGAQRCLGGSLVVGGVGSVCPRDV